MLSLSGAQSTSNIPNPNGVNGGPPRMPPHTFSGTISKANGFYLLRKCQFINYVPTYGL